MNLTCIAFTCTFATKKRNWKQTYTMTSTEGAFYDNENLTSVTIPETVTQIGSFRNCEKLVSVNIPNNVTSINNEAFSYCRSLESITLPNKINSIGERAFFYCSSLKSVTIPQSVTSIGSENQHWRYWRFQPHALWHERTPGIQSCERKHLHQERKEIDLLTNYLKHIKELWKLKTCMRLPWWRLSKWL